MIHAPHHSHRISTTTVRVKLALAITVLAAIIAAMIEQDPLPGRPADSLRVVERFDTWLGSMTSAPSAQQAAVFRTTERAAEFSSAHPTTF